MINEQNHKEIAEILLSTKAVQINTEELFTFASGIKSPIYCDNRSLIGFVKERKVVIEAFKEIIKNHLSQIDIIVGTATAGIPWASFLAHDLDKACGYVRNQKKGHGTSKLIEGGKVTGKNVLLIEDLITTGASVLAAVDVLKEAGAKNINVLAIFTYGFKKGYSSFKEHQTPLYVISNLTTLLEVGLSENYLTKSDEKILKEWKVSKDN